MNYKLIKNNLKKTFSSDNLEIVASLILLTQIFFSDVQARNIQIVLSLSNECFKSRERETCLNAIEQVENFQLIRGSEENYSCQTRLLGLESKLIMVILNKHKKPFYLSTVKDVKIFCSESTELNSSFSGIGDSFELLSFTPSKEFK